MSKAVYEFILPDIGEGISEAMLISWTVKLGQQVAEGEEVATVSTDKVDVELPAPCSGTVGELCWKPGDTIKVGSVFMRIDTGDAVIDTPAPGRRKPGGSGVSGGKAKLPTPELVPGELPPGARPAPTPGATRLITAAPSTRKLAADLGIDLASVTGSGDGGLILRADVERFAELRAAQPPAMGGVKPASRPAAGGTRREPLSGVRAAMAERMARSVHTLAHSTMNFEMRADALLGLVERLKPAAVEASIPLSVTALLAKCLEGPLRRHARFNATIDEDRRELVLHDAVNLGVAMATVRGLVVPVLAGIGGAGLFAVARQLGDVVERARSGGLQAAEMTGGTFTLSNTGGLEKATIVSTRPVINAPQAATLWVSKARQRPVVVDGALSVGWVLNASLSFDHRFIDGADTVAFINDFADMVETPERALAGE
jgi:pyruvate/2-oxoglutarate dehydrogenase complex dihydrolipoamide acyltransferase (E2) component